MTGEWKQVEGNYWPDEVSQRDSNHVAITRNVREKETEGGAILYEYEEAVIDAELFESIRSSIYVTDQEKDIEKIQADVDYIAMMADIEI